MRDFNCHSDNIQPSCRRPGAWRRACPHRRGCLARSAPNIVIGAHMQVAGFHHDRLVGREQVSLILLDAVKLSERIVLGEGRGDYYAPRRARLVAGFRCSRPLSARRKAITAPHPRRPVRPARARRRAPSKGPTAQVSCRHHAASRAADKARCYLTLKPLLTRVMLNSEI